MKILHLIVVIFFSSLFQCGSQSETENQYSNEVCEKNDLACKFENQYSNEVCEKNDLACKFDIKPSSKLPRRGPKLELVGLEEKASYFRTTDEEIFHPEISLIVGGSEANKDAWPWQVLINITRTCKHQRRNTTSICGGTLTRPEWVLTAAHCFANDSRLCPVSADTISVLAGLHDRRNSNDTNVQTSEVENLYIHEIYTNLLSGNDIALLKLKSKMKLTKSVQIVSLLSNSTNWKASDETYCVATGWGVTAEIPKMSSQVLREVQLQPYSRSLCDEYFRLLVKQSSTKNLSEKQLQSYKSPSTTFCAGPSSTAIGDTCQGDSGGPLVCLHVSQNTWFQIGITSFGNRNCSSEAGFYSSVPQHFPWINKTIIQMSNHSISPIIPPEPWQQPSGSSKITVPTLILLCGIAVAVIKLFTIWGFIDRT